MMKKMIVLLLAVVTVFATGAYAFAYEEAAEDIVHDPVEGSWKLEEVYDVTDAEDPVYLEEEDHQSFYGSGINILTFFEDGYAHDITFEGGGETDLSATWTVTDDGYEFAEEGLTLNFTYDPEEDALHRSFENYDFVYARANAGAWQLAEVIQINEGDAPTELPKEENQSLYGNAENILVFFSFGDTAFEIVYDGEDSHLVMGSWEMIKPDVFAYTADDITTEFNYFRVDDTLYYDIIEEGEDGRHLRFTYTRYEEEPEVIEETFENGQGA